MAVGLTWPIVTNPCATPHASVRGGRSNEQSHLGLHILVQVRRHLTSRLSHRLRTLTFDLNLLRNILENIWYIVILCAPSNANDTTKILGLGV